MKYPVVIKNSSALAKAKQEFEDFKNQRQSSNALAAPPSRGFVEGVSQFETLLYCGRRVGERARLVFQSLSDKAVVNGAVKISPLRSQARRAPADGVAATFTRRLEIAESYTGCPYCGHRGFVYCRACGALACWDTRDSAPPCPTCGNLAPIGREGIELEFEAAHRAAQKPPSAALETTAASSPLLLTYGATKRLR